MIVPKGYPIPNSPRPPLTPAAGRDTKVLTAWKEIARYMGKGVRTVQRWERDFALPVRRPPGARNRRAVLALTSDLDAWVALRCSRKLQSPPNETASELSRSLREHMRTFVDLRVENRMLLNELRVATQALRQNVNALRRPAAEGGEALMSNHPGHADRLISTLPN